MNLGILRTHVPMTVKTPHGDIPIVLPPLTVVELIHAGIKDEDEIWFARPLWGQCTAAVEPRNLETEAPTPKLCVTYERYLRVQERYSAVFTGQAPVTVTTIQASPPNEPGVFNWRYRLATHDRIGEPVLPGVPWRNQVQLVAKMQREMQTLEACIKAKHPDNKVVTTKTDLRPINEPADTDGGYDEDGEKTISQPRG